MLGQVEIREKEGGIILLMCCISYGLGVSRQKQYNKKINLVFLARCCIHFSTLCSFGYILTKDKRMAESPGSTLYIAA